LDRNRSCCTRIYSGGSLGVARRRPRCVPRRTALEGQDVGDCDRCSRPGRAL